ncbi:MAG: flagellar biosynthetic protein FliO [Acidovorax sp.]
MTQTLVVAVLFVGALACLPWLLRRLRQRTGGAGGVGSASRVLSQVAVGPQQRVVTVEVNVDGQRTVLVLGVTAQQVSCLHVMPGAVPAPQSSVAAGGRAEPSFSAEMVRVQDEAR